MSSSTMHRELHRVESKVLASIEASPTQRQLVVYAGLAAMLAAALGAWAWQIYSGMWVTGMNNPVFWGVYIVNFVFFIGVSHAGTLISAILRITYAGWRTPYTRMAEMITIASLPFAASCVIIDLGRPDRALNVILYPHFSSPILWDVVCISTYIMMSCTYFYIALIPDLALCRDRLVNIPHWCRALYRAAALQWTGTEKQKRVHGTIMSVMSVALLGLVASVHTNVGFIFGMTIKPGWHSAIIGPYFVAGAALQGLGGLGLVSVLLRWGMGLEPWIRENHMNQLRRFTVALVWIWAYFTGVEVLTTFYGYEPAEMHVLMAKISGPFAWSFWGMIICCFVIPVIFLVFQPFSLPVNLAVAGLVINIGMWLERYTIVVPTAARPFIQSITGSYTPSWVEWVITAGWCAGFVLVLALFLKIFPILTVWEIEEELEEHEHLVAEARKSIPPDTIG